MNDLEFSDVFTIGERTPTRGKRRIFVINCWLEKKEPKDRYDTRKQSHFLLLFNTVLVNSLLFIEVTKDHEKWPKKCQSWNQMQVFTVCKKTLIWNRSNFPWKENTLLMRTMTCKSLWFCCNWFEEPQFFFNIYFLWHKLSRHWLVVFSSGASVIHHKVSK